MKLFIILKSPQFLKGPIFIAIGDKVMLLVTRWWQVLTISYLTDSFEIIIMPKEMFYFGTIMANKFKSSFFNIRVKKKGDLRIQQCHLKVMIKTKDKFSISFGSESKLIYNELKTIQKGKTV